MSPEWSPDGKRIAYADKDGKLFVMTVETKAVIEIVDNPRGGISDYTWSPQGGHLAFTMGESNSFSRLHIWSVADGKVRAITDTLFDVGTPTWDPEGNYLFYLSRREFAPQVSSIEWNYSGNRDLQVYALTLRKDVKNPFAPESDEVTLEEEKPKEEEKKEEDSKDKKEAAKKAPEPIVIDFDGLASRVVRVPIDAGNIAGLSATKGHLFYHTSGAFYYGRDSGVKPTLHVFEFKERKATVLLEGANGYVFSADGEKILVRASGKYQRYDAKPGAKDKKDVSTQGLMVDRVPSEEWAAVFDEVWRRYRDFFYVRNMHGFDWEAIGDQYRPLVKHVAHRSDLNYVIGEMISELRVGHAYIAGGDFDIPARPQVALPGARFELD
ncbi:MAG: S41 family peptidase, partial [Verrucomicrobiales bacterium]